MYPRILIIDDERNFRDFLGDALKAEGYEVGLAGSARTGLLTAQAHLPHAVVLDQKLPDASGLDIILDLRRLPSNPVIVVITAFPAAVTAVEAMRSGALHYLPKPFEFGRLLEILDEGGVVANPRSGGEKWPELDAIVGASPEITEIRRQIKRLARMRTPTVLVQGESGTGKELIAQALHAASDRRERRLMAVNCGAFTESLLMSELFGHERDAFTGARQQRKGLFETANGGTVFLDEVGELSPGAQAALLRVLENRTIRRVGGMEEVSVDIRVVSATNRSLKAEVAAGRFREDLYYRLNIVKLDIPSLRERPDDIVLLAQHFAEKAAAYHGEPRRRITPDALTVLRRYDWPGNVRQLRNAIEYAFVTGPGPEITMADLPSEVVNPDGGSGTAPAMGDETFRHAKREWVTRFERDYVRAALARYGGNIARAARAAGMSRQAFKRLMQRHGIERAEFLV